MKIKPYKETNYYKRKMEKYIRFKNAPKNGLDIAVFGSAYAEYGFDFSDCNIKGYNFGFASQFLYYTKKLVFHYAKSIKKNGVLLICLAPMNFMREGYNEFGGSEAYYDILEKKEIGNFSIKKWIRKKISISLLFNPWRIKYMIQDLAENISEMEYNTLSEKDREKKVKERVQSWEEKFLINKIETYGVDADTAQIFERTRSYLKDILEYGRENELYTYIVIPPVSERLANYLSDDLLDRVLYENIRITNKYNIPVLDYLKDERFKDDDYYIHIDFLNKKGRRKLTGTILKEIEKGSDENVL